MTTMNIYDMADTWNDGATTFSAIKMNVTDTASASASLLMDLQVGGSSRFNVTKIGNVTSVNFIATASFRTRSDNAVLTFGASDDIILARDAANTLAQRNGVNAQAFRLYNTFTDASNYERGVLAWISNDFKIGIENAGTGSSSRQTHIYGGGQIRLYTGNSLRWYVDSAGNFLSGFDNTFDIGASGANRPRNVFWAGYQEMSEMTAPAAPAANNVRIYAVDNGSGKTQLMALFATGAAQQIAIEP